MTQHVVVWLIMDMESTKSDVNGPKKRNKGLWRTLIKLKKNEKKHHKITCKT